MRAHLLALVLYVSLLAAAGMVGAYVIGDIIGRIIVGLGG